MAQIHINTEHTREVGRRLITEGDRLAEIGHELQRAIGSLDTWAWDGRSRWRAEPLLNRVRPESARVANGLDELGRKLVRVADVFEQEDNTAARNLDGMGWVDFTPGTGKGGPGKSPGDASGVDRDGNATDSGGRGGTIGDTHRYHHVGIDYKDGFAGESTSYDLGDKKWETEKEIEVNVKGIDGALYDAEDATGDVKLGGADIGDYKADVKGGTYEAGAKVGFGEDGFTAGAYGEVGVGEATAEGVIGSTAFGVAAAGAVAGPKAGGFIGIKDNTLGASIGGSLVSAEAEAGLNIAGANVGVKGGVSLGLEFGFKIGQETEVKFGPFKVGLSFGKAKGK